MSAAGWQQIKTILHSALEQDANLVAAYLDKACAGDLELRAEIDSLLSRQDRAKDFLEVKAIDIIDQTLAAKLIEQAQPASAANGNINQPGELNESNAVNAVNELNASGRPNDPLIGRQLGDFIIQK